MKRDANPSRRHAANRTGDRHGLICAAQVHTSGAIHCWQVEQNSDMPRDIHPIGSLPAPKRPRSFSQAGSSDSAKTSETGCIGSQFLGLARQNHWWCISPLRASAGGDCGGAWGADGLGLGFLRLKKQWEELAHRLNAWVLCLSRFDL